MTTYIQTNLRSRLLCSLSAEEYFQQHPLRDWRAGDVLAQPPEKLLKQAAGAQDSLQLLSLLRQNGLSVPPIGDRGVVVEFGQASGVDAFAAYSDGRIAWFDCAQSRMIEAQVSVGAEGMYRDLFAAVEKALTKSLPMSEGAPAPAPGFALISILTADGISFGTGPSRDMAKDAVSGPIIKAALELRKVLLASVSSRT